MFLFVSFILFLPTFSLFSLFLKPPPNPLLLLSSFLFRHKEYSHVPLFFCFVSLYIFFLFLKTFLRLIFTYFLSLLSPQKILSCASSVPPCFVYFYFIFSFCSQNLLPQFYFYFSPLKYFLMTFSASFGIFLSIFSFLFLKSSESNFLP